MSIKVLEALLDHDAFSRWMWTLLFGDAIRDWRCRRHRSIGQAARRAGMDPNVWDAIEAGEQAPTPAQVALLARGLGMPEAELGALVDCCQGMWA